MHFKKLSIRNLAWIHFKLALGVAWPIVFMIFPPTGPIVELERPLLNLWMSLTIFGTITSLVGYIMSLYEGKPGVLGVSIELAGLSLFSLGPLLYFLVQVYLAATGEFELRAALCVFAYAMCSVIIYRFVMVLPRFRQEARDSEKEL